MENRNLNSQPTTANPDHSQPTIFSVRLLPHRSLGHRGFVILMGVVSVICFGIGTFFWSIGAWPVVGFLGLDVLAIYVAFRINYHDANAFEEISLSREEMLIKKCDPRGRCRNFRFNPAWARFVVNRHDEIGITRMEIASRKLRLSIGDFLNPEDRESFARAFGAALADAKR